jgi:tetratricopeptide (TPR) repeat protein
VLEAFAQRRFAPGVSAGRAVGSPTAGLLKQPDERPLDGRVERRVAGEPHGEERNALEPIRCPAMHDRLRALWDFEDLDASEQRLREQLEHEASDAGRAEVVTQLARVHGLRGDFDAGDDLIDEAVLLAGSSAIARARADLERGRLRRSSGDRESALPLFESAFAVALEADQQFIAADAAHMAALAAPDGAGFVAWTERGIALAEEHADASYWLGPLFNNLGWEYEEAGAHEQALDAFERALAARERTPESPEPIAAARYAVGKALRSLGRAQEAIPLLEQAVAWAGEAGHPDGWYHEELAEEYAAVGRVEEAREQARRAIPLLEEDDPSLAEKPERRARLASLAAV